MMFFLNLAQSLGSLGFNYLVQDLVRVFGALDIGRSAGEFDGRVPASGLTCYGFSFRAEGFGVWGLEFRASALRSRVWSPAFGVHGLGAVCLHSGLSSGLGIGFRAPNVLATSHTVTLIAVMAWYRACSDVTQSPTKPCIIPERTLILPYVSVCQNYGPFLEPYYNTAPNI